MSYSKLNKKGGIKGRWVGSCCCPFVVSLSQRVYSYFIEIEWRKLFSPTCKLKLASTAHSTHVTFQINYCIQEIA